MHQREGIVDVVEVAVMCDVPVETPISLGVGVKAGVEQYECDSGY